MAKSKAQQLKEALDAGDLDKAKALAAEIAKKPARKPAKPSTRKKGVAVRTPRSRPAQSEPEPLGVPVSTRIYDDSSWIAPSKSSMGGGSRIGSDGSVRIQARHESMQGRGRLIKFKDEPTVKLTKQQQKAEKALAKQEVAARRPPTQKINMLCEGCNRAFNVYPSETSLASDDNYRSYRYYKCDRCIMRGK